MKVIARDSLRRDYQPEKLITVSVSSEKANYIADKLNELNEDKFYTAVPDDYSLNLESMYDISDVDRPSDFISKQLGLSAIINDKNIDLTIELLNNKSNEELLVLIGTLNTILINRR